MLGRKHDREFLGYAQIDLTVPESLARLGALAFHNVPVAIAVSCHEIRRLVWPPLCGAMLVRAMARAVALQKIATIDYFNQRQMLHEPDHRHSHSEVIAQNGFLVRIKISIACCQTQVRIMGVIAAKYLTHAQNSASETPVTEVGVVR